MVGRLVHLVALLALAAVTGCTGVPAGQAPTHSPLPPDMAVVELGAHRSAFDANVLSVASGAPFAVRLRNRDADVHNFEVRDEAGQRIFVGELFRGPAERLTVVPALAAGRYVFLCTAHPFMIGELLAE
jgi:plastocyanin